MSRRGVEAKPAWREVPADVRREAERVLRSRVVRAERVFGGYAPSATFRLRLANGRRAFFKGVNASSNDYMRWALGRERQVYTRLGKVLVPWAPRFHGAVRVADWHALLLEDLGPANLPPWTATKTRDATRSFAEFHEATVADALPRWLPRRSQWGHFARHWYLLARERGALAGLVALAGPRRRDARRWLERALSSLRAAAEPLAQAPKPYALLHLDIRSDNARLHGRVLRMFDWPNACVGPHEFDVAAFAQGVAAEGGPEPERCVAWYEEVLPMRGNVLDASVAGIAGYFAERAWRPPVAGLPRLRSIQRRQLKAALAWAARRLDLPEPAWLEAVPD